MEGLTQLGVNLPSLIAYLLNFVILLGVLIFFAYKPLLRVLDQRAERIRESLAAADWDLDGVPDLIVSPRPTMISRSVRFTTTGTY